MTYDICSDPISIEPIFHYFDDGFLDPDHPKAHVVQRCSKCGRMVHEEYNETMWPWVETNAGALCVPCFFALWSDPNMLNFRVVILSLKPDPDGVNLAEASNAYTTATGSHLPYANVDWAKLGGTR